MSDAFISYARKDEDIVNRLVDALIEAGIDHWIDKDKIAAGRSDFLEIPKELEAAICVLGCWTENAGKSRHVLDECDFAFANDKLIPVLLQPVQRPFGYGRIQYYDLVAWMKDPGERAELDRLIADVKDRRRQAQRAGAQAVVRTAGFKVRETYATDFERQFAKAASALLDELSWIDQEYQFQKDWFTPLNADVEVHKGGGLDDRKIADLLDAITTDRKSPMFLVVGDPGAGKSVAMRELARHGLRLASASKMKSLSIYVNLREWAPALKWTQDNPPDTLALEAFLETHLAAYDNAFLRDFFREYLGRLHTDGRIFWIFDSFDEIPAVLDAGAGTEAKWIIDKLSSVLWRFIRQGSRGVISSRPTRRPELPSDLATQLIIRPFGEDKIDAALKKVNAFPAWLIRTLLSARPDLLPLARTPFYLGLIAEFGARQRRLPNTQVELFEAYILNRLGSNALRVADAIDPAIAQAIRASEDMAHFLLTSTHGLEAPLDVLRSRFPGIDIAASIARLTQAKIMRMGRAPALFCSFAHRRVQEYFVIRHMVRTHVPFDHEWVAADSSMRDAAVLYVELASDQEGRQIARRCWQEIAAQPPDKVDYANPAFWRTLHCQRFLTEAFRARLPALDAFRADLAARVYSVLTDSPAIWRGLLRSLLAGVPTRDRRKHIKAGRTRDLIMMKLAVETLGLLPEESIPDILDAALRNGDPWIRESAVNASRFLPKVKPNLAGRIWRSIAAMPADEFRREYNRLCYAFDLASGLSDVARPIRLRGRDDRDWRWIGRWIAAGFASWYLPLVLIVRAARLRHPGNELAAIATTGDKDLVKLEDDGRSGLSGYRKVLASPWSAPAGIGILALLAEIVGLRVYYVRNASDFGPGYTFAAVIYVLEAWSAYVIPLVFMAVSLLIASYFAGRNYPLILPGEDIQRHTWRSLAGELRDVFNLRTIAVAGPLLATAYGSIPLLEYTVGSELYLKGFFWIAMVSVPIAIIGLLVRIGAKAISTVERWVRDRKVLAADGVRLETLTNGDNNTRALIFEHFMAFQTAEFREKFVRWLGLQRFGPEGRGPTGDWPDGRPPNCGDEASSLLARLEHRWRGLDR